MPFITDDFVGNACKNELPSLREVTDYFLHVTQVGLVLFLSFLGDMVLE